MCERARRTWNSVCNIYVYCALEVLPLSLLPFPTWAGAGSAWPGPERGSCSYGDEQQQEPKLLGKQLGSTAGVVAKAGCLWPPGSWGQVGEEWLRAGCPDEGMILLIILPLYHFHGFVLQPSGANPSMSWSSSLLPESPQGEASSSGMGWGGWWVSKSRFVPLSECGLGYQLVWIMLPKATLNICIGSLSSPCPSQHIPVAQQVALKRQLQPCSLLATGITEFTD